MLTHMHIRNFILIDELELELATGMTAMTGETGVGKSILLDALTLCLGGRAENHIVRKENQPCEISAHFDLQKIPMAQQWLRERDLAIEETECVLRRVINTDGRSRCYINGVASTLQQAAELSELIVDIHGQHEQQRLLKRDHQRQLLDSYANNDEVLQLIKAVYQRYQDKQQQSKALQTQGDHEARKALLRYQVEELQILALTDDEVPMLESRYKALHHAERLIQICEQTLALSDQDEGNIASRLTQITHLLQPFIDVVAPMKNMHELFHQALIHVQEGASEINDYLQQVDVDAEQLQQISARLDKIHELARKHHVPAKELHQYQLRLVEELQQLDNSEESIQLLQQEMVVLKKEYETLASKLTKARQVSSKKLCDQTKIYLHQLGMQHAELQVAFNTYSDQIPRMFGEEQIELLIRTNPGQPFLPVNKIASGGELSRVSLAINVIAAQRDVMGTLIFDEVDVGIGGNTAAIVGQLLKKLGENTQVLCVTHQPQVAAQAQQHFRVEKNVVGQTTQIHVKKLTNKEKIQEIARMLGGVKITEQTLAHAREMVGSGNC